MNTLSPLVREIINRQGKQNDSDYAKFLNIPRSTWRSIKAGKRNLGNGSIAPILTAYPDLGLAVLEYLKDGSK